MRCAFSGKFLYSRSLCFYSWRRSSGGGVEEEADSACIGDPVTPVCAVETLIACSARLDTGPRVGRAPARPLARRSAVFRAERQRIPELRHPPIRPGLRHGPDGGGRERPRDRPAPEAHRHRAVPAAGARRRPQARRPGGPWRRQPACPPHGSGLSAEVADAPEPLLPSAAAPSSAVLRRVEAPLLRRTGWRRRGFGPQAGRRVRRRTRAPEGARTRRRFVPSTSLAGVRPQGGRGPLQLPLGPGKKARETGGFPPFAAKFAEP